VGSQSDTAPELLEFIGQPGFAIQCKLEAQITSIVPITYHPDKVNFMEMML
jgi:hypothetical protein